MLVVLLRGQMVPLMVLGIRQPHFNVDAVPLSGSGGSEVNFRDKIKTL